MLPPTVAQALSTMEPGNHCVLIYDSRENKREVLFSHLTRGKSDSKMVYVCSEERPEQIREGMSGYGIDVNSLSERERLVISNYDEVYIGKDGTVDIQGIIDGFAKLAWACKRNSLDLRASAEMSCFFKRGKVVELLEYERALGGRFYFPGMGICAYNVLEMQSSGSLDVLMPLLRAHGRVILTGPKGAAVLEPEQVQERQVEQVLQVRI